MPWSCPRGRRIAGAIVGATLDTIDGGIPDGICADYLACYDGDRFAESMRYAEFLDLLFS